MGYDPAINLTRYPMPMTQYGSNPYGEDLYRIVYAASVRHLLGGRFLWKEDDPDQPACADEYRWIPTYDFDGWILERWHTPFQFAGMSQAQWDRQYRDPLTGFLTLGPYPSRGQYAEVHRFTCAVADANIGKLVTWVEQSQKNSWQDVRDANQDAYDKQEKDTRTKRLDIINETRRAHGHRPMAGAHASFNSKTIPDAVTANQLARRRGMPLPKQGQGHKFVTRSH